MITLAHNPSATGCPIIDGGRPPGYLPITITDGDRTTHCWLSVASAHAATIVAAPIIVQDTEIPALRLSRAIGWGHFRTDAERLLEATANTTTATLSAQRAARLQAIRDIKSRIGAKAPGARTPVEVEFFAIVKHVLGEE